MTDELELRLRGALAARAGQITQERLRFGIPPTVAVPRKPSRLWRWLPLPAGVAIAAVALTLALGPRSPEPPPVQPADPVVTAPPSTPGASSPGTPEPAPSKTPSKPPSASAKAPLPAASTPASGRKTTTAVPAVTPDGRPGTQ